MKTCTSLFFQKTYILIIITITMCPEVTPEDEIEKTLEDLLHAEEKDKPKEDSQTEEEIIFEDKDVEVEKESDNYGI